MDISKKVTMLDDAFSTYLLDQNERMFCKNIATILTGFSNKEFRVDIVPKKASEKEPFFGMRIFPDSEWLESICKEISSNDAQSINNIINRWKEIPKWVIEIDERVFDRMLINFNPKELTAMLLHEVGHTIYSDKKIEMFYRVYRECQFKLTTTDRVATRMLYFLYIIPLTVVCGMREWQITSNDLKEEIFADQSVQKLGYAEYLISAYEKIIKACGNSSGYVSESKMEDALQQSITWCNVNAVDLDRRKQKLKDELYTTGESSHSGFIRNLVRSIMKQLCIVKKERYTGNIVMESTLSIDFDDPDFVQENLLVYDIPSYNKMSNMISSMQELAKNEIAQEAFGRKKKPEIPSQLEVDTIFVEIDRMENHADRRYVLDLIYHQEEKIEKFKECFQYNQDLKHKYAGKMESMLKELESMRQMVLSKRSFDKNYKVFVKYPAGYEG